MDSKSLLYIVFIAIGLIVYARKPKYLMFFWLSARAILFPLFLYIFRPHTSGNLGVYDLYYSLAAPLVYVMAMIIALTSYKTKSLELGKIMIPLIVLICFLAVQNILVGFDYDALYKSIIEVLFLVIPTLALCSNESIRPQRSTLIKFIVVFVIVEVFFCILNTQGIRLYADIQDSNVWEDSLIAGTFPRYSHLTNYLTTFYLVMALSYFGLHIVSKRLFYILTAILAVVIIMSGAKMSVILFLFVLVSSLILFERKNVFLLAFMGIVLYISAVALIGKFNSSNLDQSNGIERNVTGLVELFTTKSSEGNTLSLSDMVLITCYNDPILGNGMANRNWSSYDFDSYPESTLKTDARLAYMFVEYGVIGCLFFLYFFYGIFRTNFIKSELKDRKIWIIVIFYFILFTFTETGIFDMFMLTILSSFAFSQKDDSIFTRNGPRFIDRRRLN